MVPQPRIRNACRLSHVLGLASSAFRSPLLTESRLFSLPVGTEMFHFPTFPPHALCVQAWVTGHDSCRVSPFGNPRITARLTAPRGLSQPPTSFIGSWCQGIHRAPLITWPQRCSRPLCSSQRTGGVPALTRRVPRSRSGESFDEGRSRAEGEATMSPFPQDPTACLGRPSSIAVRSSRRSSCTRRGHVERRPTSQCSTHEHHPRDIRPEHGSGPTIARLTGQVLLRKEVIQPHLPVRLPCYDFVPIASPTFDGSLHAGWATGFGCYRLS